jgi:3'(2'), 5'-bisphosphate nucleotidase
VNIALIHHNSPILGVIYLPEKNQCYYAIHNQGSFKIQDCNDISSVHKLCVRPVSSQKIQTISSRSYEQSYHYFQIPLNITQTIRVGAAIKFCLIAEGLVDIYPRTGQTGEWDTAAGELIVTEAGGYVRDTHHKPLLYGKMQKNFLNDAFYAANSILSAQ